MTTSQKLLLNIIYFSLMVSSSTISDLSDLSKAGNYDKVQGIGMFETNEFGINGGNNDDAIAVDDLFGTNSRFFTVCSSETCCKRTLESKEHENKVMLFLPLSHIDGDSYCTYYMGLIFEMFEKVDVHILVWSITHSLHGGPYHEIAFMSMLKACVTTGDHSVYSYEFCVHFSLVMNDIALFCTKTLYHQYLTLIVINDATITAGYVDIIESQLERSNNSSPLFALVHLNHEQPWVDNQRYCTQRILQGYRSCRLVLRTHYYTDFVTDNVHYLPLGAGA
jgi:hypothetical protein